MAREHDEQDIDLGGEEAEEEEEDDEYLERGPMEETVEVCPSQEDEERGECLTGVTEGKKGRRAFVDRAWRKFRK
ncbi:hypothetical protein NLG97_g2560 [Lecanicillium saksenae]|uniref:Uncharacterized protein n=1 Tax=Lecanicillium saksenae TaxID=468837 RepID=A0ACC1R194_9HYPO|nr:hypothetical protein NLG97_g2560 [Lecanicillium saksenae]